MLHVFVVKRLG